MPSFKISQLSELTNAVDADFFEIVDDSELTISDKNKRITFENLKLSIFSAARIDSDFPAWNVATTYDSADNPQYVSYNSRLYQFAKSSGTDTGTTPGTDATVWAAVGGVEFFAPPATDAEAAAKTATNRYLTPANLAASGVVDTLYSIDGSLTSNRTVTLGTYTLDINLDSTGTFAIQDGGTDVFTVNASGNVNVQNNELYFGGSLFASLETSFNGIFRIGESITSSIGDGSTTAGNLVFNVATGSENTGFGNGVFSSNTTGNRNIGIGRSVGNGVTTGAGNIAIGNKITFTDSNASNILVFAAENSTLTVPSGYNGSIIFGRSNEYDNIYIGTDGTTSQNVTFNTRGITSGTTNTASGSFTIQSGQSTGSADGGNLIFKVSDGGASGTAQNSQSTVFELGASKIGMYGVTPTARATTGIGAATFTANTSGISDDTATWGGYTIGQVVQALQTIGILT